MVLARTLASVFLAFSLATPSYGADQAEPGFELTALANPITSVSRTLSNGDFVVLGNFGIYRYSSSGTLLRTITLLSGGYSPACIWVDPSETYLLAGLGMIGTCRVDMATGAKTVLSAMAGSSMVVEGQDSILLGSVQPLGPDADVTRLDLQSGALDPVIHFRGQIRALARDDAGSLYVTHEGVPGVAESWEVLRFTSTQVAAGGLTERDGTPLVRNRQRLEGLAVEGDASALYFTESVGRGNTLVWSRHAGRTPKKIATLQSVFSGLQLLPGAGPAEFLAYQPPGGGTLILSVDGPGRRSLAPSRPIASVSGPGLSGSGPFDLHLDGGPPNGLAFVFFGPSGSIVTPELVFAFRFPIFFGLGLATYQRLLGGLVLNDQGSLAVPFVHSTGTPKLWAIQMILLDAQGRLTGSSTVAFL